ncbi:dihydroorotase [Patescibacteria group bacterium]|nr:MAG: dihydroorotase [Patescibacteria group bacterium]
MSRLITLPALIDPHVHFRTPGSEHKEDWICGARAAFAGGYTTVIDMPNNNPPAIDEESLNNKIKLVEQQLSFLRKQEGSPSGSEFISVHPYFYLGVTPLPLDKGEAGWGSAVALKMFMGSSTGSLLVDKYEDQEKIFAKAAELDLLVAVHAEDDETIKNNQLSFQQKLESIANPVALHSQIRSREAAIKAVSQAIELAEKTGARLYICHISTKEEAELVKSAKERGAKIYAEVTPHHLFLNESAYETLETKAQMNPPLRTAADQAALWQAINDGVIDTIGTDHAPHTLEEKNQPYPKSPSGVPGIETCLPLLLNAYNQGKISLEKIVELCRTNPQKIFRLPDNSDEVIVDLDLEKEVKNENLKTKCGWSPFAGWNLKGWPIKTIIMKK